MSDGDIAATGGGVQRVIATGDIVTASGVVIQRRLTPGSFVVAR